MQNAEVGMSTVLTKKIIKTPEKSPFGVMLKFKLHEEFLLEQTSNLDKMQALEKEFPLLYTVRYEETMENQDRQINTVRYRAQEGTTFTEAESRWMYDFSFTNVQLLSITKEKIN
jgi:hypothetical protein